MLLDLDQAQNNISGAVGVELVSYTTVSFPAWNNADATGQQTLEDAVQDGENNLQSDLISYTEGCTVSQDKIVLVGYSMGAWVINKRPMRPEVPQRVVHDQGRSAVWRPVLD